MMGCGACSLNQCWKVVDLLQTGGEVMLEPPYKVKRDLD